MKLKHHLSLYCHFQSFLEQKHQGEMRSSSWKARSYLINSHRFWRMFTEMWAWNAFTCILLEPLIIYCNICLGHFTKLPLSYTLEVKKEKRADYPGAGRPCLPEWNRGKISIERESEWIATYCPSVEVKKPFIPSRTKDKFPLFISTQWLEMERVEGRGLSEYTDVPKTVSIIGMRKCRPFNRQTERTCTAGFWILWALSIKCKWKTSYIIPTALAICALHTFPLSRAGDGGAEALRL